MSNKLSWHKYSCYIIVKAKLNITELLYFNKKSKLINNPNTFSSKIYKNVFVFKQNT